MVDPVIIVLRNYHPRKKPPMMNHRLPPGLLLAALLTFASQGLAQYSSVTNSTLLMRLVGEQSGTIIGEVTQAGREDSHRLLAYSHEIVAPYDPASGQSTGKQQHHPFRVVKLINRASPVLLEALAAKERLTTVMIDMWVPSPTGKEAHIFTYELTNARLVSLRSWMPNKSDPAAAGYPPAEELAFTYEKIKFTFEEGGIVGEDTWVAPET